jgi:BMFP domain-containing protein YqiC
MALKAREENAKLSARIDALEARIADLTASADKSAAASGSRARK